MKNYGLRLLLLSGLLLVFGTVSFAQKTKRPQKPVPAKIIVSNDWNKPEPKPPAKVVQQKRSKKWKKRCRYVYYKRNGRKYRRYRCFQSKG